MRWQLEKEEQVDEHTRLEWHRSTRCSSGGCIEVARTAEEFLVRDSKVSGGSILSFGADGWGDFVAAVCTGEFSTR
jgi:hypothetical protein